MKKRDRWAFGYRYEKTPKTPNRAPDAPSDGLKLVLLILLNKVFKMFGYRTLNMDDIIKAFKYSDKKPTLPMVAINGVENDIKHNMLHPKCQNSL